MDVVIDTPLIGIGPLVVLGGIALLCLLLAVLLWRGHHVWRWVFVGLFLIFGLATAGDYVNTKFAYYDTVADLLGIPTYPTVDGLNGGTGGEKLTPQPNGAVTQIHVPDTQSHFGSYDATVWLPPQYFDNPRAHFPVVMLLHGNPGQPTDWLTSADGKTTFLTVAQSGKPVIVVMPEDLQNDLTGDSLCLDTAAQGNAETYLTRDVVAAMDSQLRTIVGAQGRAIGGLSMGGYCALNLGLKHPDLFSAVLDLSGDVKPLADTLPGGLQQLFGSNWQQQADANDPSKYYAKLDGSKGPAIYFGVGSGDVPIITQMEALIPQLKSKGFTVEYKQLPGAHEYTYWTAGLRDGLPGSSNG